MGTDSGWPTRGVDHAGHRLVMGLWPEDLWKLEYGRVRWVNGGWDAEWGHDFWRGKAFVGDNAYRNACDYLFGKPEHGAI